MKKKVIILLLVIVSIVASVIAYHAVNSEKPENWTHTTFRGTVTDIWIDGDNRYFTLSPYLLETEHNFIINAETLYVIVFDIGDEVIVESDYNMNEHNGDDIPYPAVMVTDPNTKDKE